MNKTSQSACGTERSSHLVQREIGNSGIFISPLGFGASPLGNEFGDIDEEQGIKAVLKAVSLGVNFFDVSPYYGRTRAETVLGKALRQLPRASYVISTKVGRYDVNTFDFSAERVKRSVEESMQRLGVTHLDLVQCHDIEYGNLDQIATETIPALLKLKSEGKIRAIGITGYPLEIFPYVLSCVPRGSVDVVLSYCNYCMLNDRLSLLLPALKREGVSVINASPLCMGLLTPGGGPAWHPADKETKAVVRRAEELCRQRGKDLASIALQWALQADPGLVVNTLVGIDSVETLEKNLDVIGSPPDKDLMGDILAVLKPVRNRTWDSGRFQGNSNLTA